MSTRLIVPFMRRLRSWLLANYEHERTRELIGSLLASNVTSKHDISSLHEVEFRVYSQFGDDGIIQWLVSRLPSLPKKFVEFGVQDYSESNTRFLLINNNWRGLVIDGSVNNISDLCSRDWFWRYDLTAISYFLTQDNVEPIIMKWANESEIGLLHIDVDGNDYWLWQALSTLSPAPGIVIIEYNAVFGDERAITIPYRADFERYQAHYSGLYAGASLAALTHLANSKGYALIGVNSAGNNAYFVRRDLLGKTIKEADVSNVFVESKFRESRDQNGRLNYRSFTERATLIRGMPVVNVLTGGIEPF